MYVKFQKAVYLYRALCVSESRMESEKKSTFLPSRSGEVTQTHHRGADHTIPRRSRAGE
jgi:hypothetical protein